MKYCQTGANSANQNSKDLTGSKKNKKKQQNN